MIAPLFKYGLFGDFTGLVFAFLIGIGFGWFLERAGFGSAKVLAAQFYLHNMTVLKVMFTAIVTAMLGLGLLSAVGWLDLSKVYVTPTFLVPQIVGGLLLGVGFVIGGYCPGTSLVAASTGRLDGMVFVLGVFFGVFVFGEVYPAIEPFTQLTPMGTVTIPEFFGVGYGTVMFAVVVMAIGMFLTAEWAEKKFKREEA